MLLLSASTGSTWHQLQFFLGIPVTSSLGVFGEFCLLDLQCHWGSPCFFLLCYRSWSNVLLDHLHQHLLCKALIATSTGTPVPPVLWHYLSYFQWCVGWRCKRGQTLLFLSPTRYMTVTAAWVCSPWVFRMSSLQLTKPTSFPVHFLLAPVLYSKLHDPEKLFAKQCFV